MQVRQPPQSGILRFDGASTDIDEYPSVRLRRNNRASLALAVLCDIECLCRECRACQQAGGDCSTANQTVPEAGMSEHSRITGDKSASSSGQTPSRALRTLS